MRALISLGLIIAATIVALTYPPYPPYSPMYDFSGRLWESHEVILNQNENIATSDSSGFISVKTQLTVLFIDDGKFTASMNAVVEYKNGNIKSFTQELAGSWVTQDDYVDMSVEVQRHVDQQTVMGQSEEEDLIYSIDHYARMLLEQTYIINYYKGNLVLVSSHIGGPIFTLTEKK